MGSVTTWVCRFCGDGSFICEVGLVPRSQGMGSLVGDTVAEANNDAEYDSGYDEAFWEAEVTTGYECRACSAATVFGTLEELVVPAKEDE